MKKLLIALILIFTAAICFAQSGVNIYKPAGNSALPAGERPCSNAAAATNNQVVKFSGADGCAVWGTGGGDPTAPETFLNKVIDGNSNTVKILRHATDCTSFTGAVDGQYCWERDANLLYVCETADVCDTPGEWAAVASGGSPLTVEEADAVPTVSNVSKIQFDQADGFTVTDETGGQIQIDLGITDALVPNNITIDLATLATLADGLSTTGKAAAETYTNKTIDGNNNTLAALRHATDCTGITTGVAGQFCYEIDSDNVYVCEPTAGGCDTAGEWKLANANNAVTANSATTAGALGSDPTDCTTAGQFATAIGANGNLTCSKPDGTLEVFRPQEYAPPVTNFARIDSRNTTPILNFNTTTSECAVWTKVMPRNYAGNGVTMTIYAVAPTLTTGTLQWDVYFEAIGTAQDLDADGFAAAQSTSATSVSATSGIPIAQTVSLTNGAQMDSVAAGDPYRLKICRNVTGDNLPEDGSFVIGELKEP